MTTFSNYTLVCVLFFGSLLCSLSAPSLVGAEIYRWSDRNGKIHYATNPPSDDVSGAVEVKRNNRWLPYTSGERGVKDSTPSSPITYTTSNPGADSNQPVPFVSASSGETVLPYQHSNGAIIVDVMINDQITRPFILDTGASYTIISPQIADALFLKPTSRQENVTLQTANGQINAPLVILQSVRLGSLKTSNVTAAIHEFDETSTVYGLLGLSFLNRFQVTVDAEHRQIILKAAGSRFQKNEQNCATAREYVRKGQALEEYSEQQIASYRKAIGLCPDFVEAYYRLGAIYLYQQQAEDALNIHRKIVEMQPDQAEAYFRLGVAYLLNRNLDDAKKFFQKALQLDPTHQQATEYLHRIKND